MGYGGGDGEGSKGFHREESSAVDTQPWNRLEPWGALRRHSQGEQMVCPGNSRGGPWQGRPAAPLRTLQPCEALSLPSVVSEEAWGIGIRVT